MGLADHEVPLTVMQVRSMVRGEGVKGNDPWHPVWFDFAGSEVKLIFGRHDQEKKESLWSARRGLEPWVLWVLLAPSTKVLDALPHWRVA